VRPAAAVASIRQHTSAYAHVCSRMLTYGSRGDLLLRSPAPRPAAAPPIYIYRGGGGHATSVL
jgi:hypothetical protein